jgi:hypothetical protein
LADPVTTAIATAVAGSAAQSLTAQAAHVLAQITSRIRRRLGAGSGDLAIPAGPDAGPGSPGRAAVLAALLHSAFQEDPAFGRELTALWHDYLNATASPVTNNFHGTAGNAVQLRDVHGNLNIG